MKTALLLLVLLPYHIAYAGGDVVQARKVAFTRGMGGGYVLSLETIGANESLYGCKHLVIEGTYNFWRWNIVRRSSNGPTWTQHRYALQELERVNTPLYFGTIGQALKRTREPCKFRSEGLTANYGPDGSLNVTTFYLTS